MQFLLFIFFHPHWMILLCVFFFFFQCRLDVNARNNYDETALDLASENCHAEVKKLLQNVELPPVSCFCHWSPVPHNASFVAIRLQYFTGYRNKTDCVYCIIMLLTL